MDWTSEEGKKLLAEADPEDLLLPPDVNDIVSFAEWKHELAELLGWPYLPNVTWYTVWQGGWCLLARAAVLTPQDNQRSMNFEISSEVQDPAEALVLAVGKVRENPGRLQERIRWYCDSHDWEEIVPRGQMHAGCPECGGYYCEPYKDPEESG